MAARDRLVRELRGRKDRELAARVAKLRRPTLSLWLANRLHEVAGDQLRDLLSAGGELQAAQARAAAGDASARRRFRELIGRHSQLIDGLVRAGLELSEQQGHGSGEEVGRRLAATLRAASSEPGEGGRALLEGSLDAEMESGGFDLLASPAGFPTVIPGTAGGEEKGEEPRESALEKAARAAEARRAAVESERAAVAARSQADELSRQADALARAARKAREEADAAQEKAREAEEAAAEARQAARDLERPQGT